MREPLRDFRFFKKDNLILDDRPSKKSRAKLNNLFINVNTEIPMTHVGKGRIL
jgi:hypothetical protein